MDQDVDLWGDPIPLRPERRGRPHHDVTDEKRKRVKVLAALRQPQSEIAHAMGISEPTLRRYYFRELRGGLAQIRAAVLVALADKALTGDVGAMREFFRQAERADLTPSLAAARPARDSKPGKKEQADLDAGIPDTSSSMGALLAERENRRLN